MTLTQIATLINQSLRFKMSPDQLTKYIDMVHKQAFGTDMIGFKYWDNTLTIYQQLNYDTVGTTPDANDVGTTVTGATSSSTGTVISYDTTEKYVVVETSDDFTAGEQITGTEGLDVTLKATDHQEGYKGPYDWPTSPPVRKMIGVTIQSDARIFGEEPSYLDQRDDYGLLFDEYNARSLYKKHRKDIFAKTLTFINEPTTSSDEVYRWVYFRYPETILTLSSDDSKFLIPDTYHNDFVQACIEQANVTTKDARTSSEIIKAHFKDWLYDVQRAYTPMGSASNQTSQGCDNCDSYM